MNEDLQRKLSSLEGLIATQKDCINPTHISADYMHGMANGMIMAHSIFADQQPDFVIRPRRHYNRNVRHKCVKSKRNR